MCFSPARGHRVLDLARDLGFQLRGRRTGQRRGDGDGGQLDVGEIAGSSSPGTRARPPVSMHEQQDRGIGLRIDQVERFIVLASASLSRRRARYRRRPGSRRRRHHPRVGGRPPVISIRSPHARADADLQLLHLVVGARREHVVESRRAAPPRLRQRDALALADLELAAREHAGLGRAGLRQIDVDDAVARRGSTVGATMRTVPASSRRRRRRSAPSARAGCARVRSRPPPRAIRAAPCGSGGTVPAPAAPRRRPWPVRDEITPSSGARMRVCASRTSVGLSRARSDLTRALGGRLGRHVLLDLLRADRAAGLQLARALGIGRGIGLRGLGLGDAGARWPRRRPQRCRPTAAPAPGRA